MDGPVRLSFLIVIASGAMAIAILSFTGAVWPYAPSDAARAPLAFANAATLVTFLSLLMIFAGGALVSAAASRAWHGALTNSLAALFFLIGLVVAGIQVSDGMNAWFETTPRMPDAMIVTVRTGILIGFAWLVLSLALASWSLLRRKPRG